MAHEISRLAAKQWINNEKETGNYYMGFPNIKGTILGVPVIRITVFLGLCWGLMLGKLPHYLCIRAVGQPQLCLSSEVLDRKTDLAPMS